MANKGKGTIAQLGKSKTKGYSWMVLGVSTPGSSLLLFKLRGNETNASTTGEGKRGAREQLPSSVIPSDEIMIQDLLRPISCRGGNSQLRDLLRPISSSSLHQGSLNSVAALRESIVSWSRCLRVKHNQPTALDPTICPYLENPIPTKEFVSGADRTKLQTLDEAWTYCTTEEFKHLIR
ncbi:hypothetical protein F3Y22_tig00112285pilonHSYRG00129 [Hibiscus syriacus]|uniref:Uncharacterized protein n=1 Tax=Hibiscus syriacus TaxID=106335 RepID=A0A6A2X2C9_HIBSY|nr:hypothetical protein F3Y22_tig00112285pilonHSYRG00129 [Hibiscus syriacus]